MAPGAWLLLDDAYGAQMSYRERLLADRRAAVVALTEDAGAAAAELLELVVGEVTALHGFASDGDAGGRAELRCPDGRRVAVDPADPLGTCGRLVQEDLVILQNRGGTEHVLTGAVLCFPASWTLAQKLGRPLTAIHSPVASYDANIARRVQRLFDGLQVGQPIWRANALIYDDPDLHQPRLEGDHRAMGPGPRWLRVERQTLRRLPETGAVVFGIHTFVVPADRLEEADREALGLSRPAAGEVAGEVAGG